MDSERRQIDLRSKIHSPITHLVLYSLLLVFTPFIMLQNYLQQSVGDLSELSVHPFGVRVPVVFGLATLLFAVFLVWAIIRKKLTPIRVAALLFCFLMIAMGQKITDFYCENPFYDLQNNWHYIAYALFAFFFYRAFKSPFKRPAKFILLGYSTALGLSLFDEIFQRYLSSRVFDLSDVAKDGWGVLIGIIIILFVVDQGRSMGKFSVVQNKLADYLHSPWSLLVFALVFNLIFLNVSSFLTESRFVSHVAGITFGLMILIFIVVHLTRFKAIRIAVIILLVAGIIALGVSHVHHRDENITYNRFGLIVYRGIPVPFFDIMIFPDGGFRPVDKKHYFNPGDRTTILKLRADIVLVGTGYEGRGGRGMGGSVAEFGYNPYLNRNSQVILLPTPRAIEVYNRLRGEGKRVLFIIHTTC